MRKILFATLLIIASVWLGPTFAQDRALYWDALTVNARLDADGALHVTERHAMVFHGEWNGGERSFQLRSWQSLRLESFREIDTQTQRPIEWSEGDLDEPGEYELSGEVLRWRNRRPEDPPFSQAKRIYEITYVLDGVLVPEDGRYLLEHNLAFPERSGIILDFDATLEIDPAWDAGDLGTQWHEENLAPGESVFAQAALTRVGAGEPSAVAKATALPSATAFRSLRVGLLIGILAFVLLHVASLLKREQRNGRFQPTVPLDEIDAAWLQKHVFNRPPEVIGAAWDMDTSASEVAALLARLAQQGALKTEVRSSGSGWFSRDIMHMELLCDRDRLAAHERKLIDALFFDGSRTTDTDKIKKHYAKSGFAPAGMIQSAVEAQLPMIFANRVALPAWAKVVTVIGIIGGVAGFVSTTIWAPDTEPAYMITVLTMLGVYVFGLVFAYLYRLAVHELRGKLIRVLIVVAILCGMLAFNLVSGRIEMIPFAMIGLTLLTMAYLNSIFNMMRSREMLQSLELRRQLVSARLYFERELKSPSPRLQDEWFPYLLAFGLGPHIDKWFKSIAPEATRNLSRATAGGIGVGHASRASSSSSIGSSTASSTWTGGGGTFGGAGATGAWSSAVGTIASGVAKPSSSSGRSGGGGSSRSSGGGGGGGW